MSFPVAAQQSQPAPANGAILTAHVDPPAGADPAKPSAASDPNTPATAPAASATPDAAATISNAELMKNMMEMKAEITELKTALKSRDAADAASADAIKAYEHDVASLKAAVTPTTAVTASASPSPAQAAAPAVPATAPAPPEITAETTTKSAPFPGDWTWLNSGGHNSDSPMSTKYFTPEIRFDTNYILDYNHPQDDSMGGSTEMFRSDEWQLEQASVGGDFRIQNVRGRILTMFGEFATTTIRNDGSYSRGQW
ncbi:MAG: hypothetical protein WAU67_16545, partial [Terracidiphilus sp.]